MTRWPIILLLSLTVAVIFIPMVVTAMRDSRNRTILNVGYLTAITGELKDKQGLAISGALTLALDEVLNLIKHNRISINHCSIYSAIN